MIRATAHRASAGSGRVANDRRQFLATCVSSCSDVEVGQIIAFVPRTDCRAKVAALGERVADEEREGFGSSAATDGGPLRVMPAS